MCPFRVFKEVLNVVGQSSLHWVKEGQQNYCTWAPAHLVMLCRAAAVRL